jgi:acyl-[acyl-carrier-protein] desaturase
MGQGHSRKDQDRVQLPLERLRHHIDGYNRLADDSNWNRFKSLHWNELNPSLLTEGQKNAVVFVTYVEDHLPGYFSEYQSLFPIETESMALSLHNRELFHFTVRWGLEEDRHAQALALYQYHAGIEPDRNRLEEKLIIENRKPFSIGFSQPVQVFTYTLLQEKATQLYYQSLSRVVKEPVLNRLLIYLTKDESRHFGFFSEMVDSFVESYGEKVLSLIEEVALNYKMPLHNTMEDYRRRAILMAREAPGYDRMLPQKVLMRQLKRLGERLPDLSEKIDDSISRMMDALRITTIEGVA